MAYIYLDYNATTPLHDEVLAAMLPYLKDNYGHPVMRLPNTLHVSFAGINARELLDRVPEVCVTTGAACADNTQELSGLLRAMGVWEEVGFGSIRFSIGLATTKEEIDRAIQLCRRQLYQ